VGYSRRSLVDKLGIRTGQRIAILGAPPAYDRTLGPLPPGVARRATARAGDRLDLIQFFTVEAAVLGRRLPALRRAIAENGAIWVSWPKRASGVSTDVSEDVVRTLALTMGLVDVKVCAVDETWSGLKLVVPVRLREAR
jgi:hypothetical protein